MSDWLVDATIRWPDWLWWGLWVAVHVAACLLGVLAYRWLT